MRIFRPFAACAIVGAFIGALALPASANILIEIDKSSQRMTVSQNGQQLYTWPVSTGQRGYDTPSGEFKPFRMEKDHFSREWDDAPMPNSIFFTTKGHAIHGTEHVRNIGRPASHGCVRLEPQNARVLFGLVKQEGMANTRVVLTGTLPAAGAPAMVRRAPRYDDDDMPTGSVPSQAVRGYPRDDRPIYWGQRQAPPRDVYEDDWRYRRPPPPPGFFGGRPGWD
jgi:L,D-transpeptidase catalytic domain